MTELGTVVAAGRPLPAACVLPTLPVLWLPVLGRHSPGCGEIGFLSSDTPALEWGRGREAASRDMGRGAGKAAGELGHPTVRLCKDIRTPGDKTEGGFLAGRGLGDTYLINWPRSSHRVSQPGHLHSPCP